MCKIRREWGGGDLPGGMNYSKMLGYLIPEKKLLLWFLSWFLLFLLLVVFTH